MEKLFELKDIALIPSSSNTGYRSKINHLTVDSADVTGMSQSLPIFTSPMEAIIDSNNWKVWQDQGIKPVLPRTEELETRLAACCYIFSAFSIEEVRSNFLSQNRRSMQNQFHVCIDCGNGHDSNLLELGHRLKQLYGQQLILMAGNIGSPETYINYCKAGFDYVRVGMSGGSLVDRNKYGFYYPMGSLLYDITMVKSKACIGLKPVKIIADGGIRSQSDVMKCIALGADYVMIGREFSKLIEAAGTIYRKTEKDGEEIMEEVRNPESLLNIPLVELVSLDLVRQYCGNTTPEIQAIRQGYRNIEEWKKQNPRIKISDSSWEWIKIEESLQDWIRDFKDCVDYSFMMSNAADYETFRKNVKFGRIS